MRDLSVLKVVGVFFCAATLMAGAAAASEIEIRGRIVDDDGEGMVRVVVEMWPWLGRFDDDLRRLESGAGDDPLAVVRSDGQGFFALKAPLGSNLRLRARAPGRLPMEVRLAYTTDDVELRTVTMSPASKVKVRVVSRGKPIAGARVGLESYWMEGFWQPGGHRGMSGEDGIVKLRRAVDSQGIWGRHDKVSVFSPGRVPDTSRLPDSGTATIDLAAGVPREIEVRDAADHPVAGALVRVQGAWPVGVTDDQGRLIVHPPVGGSLRVSAETAAGDWGAEEIAAPAADESEPAILKLKEPAIIAGRVIDARSDRPVAGARVWLETNPGRFTESARDGSYRLLLPVNRRDLTRPKAAAPGYLRQDRQERYRPGSSRDLKLEPWVPLRGWVVDAEGEAIAAAEVIARSPRASDLFVRSGDDGSFRLGAASDVLYRLEVKKRGYVTARPEAAAGDDRELEVVLPYGLPGEGAVVDVRGRPIPGAEVTLSEPESYSLPSFSRERDESLQRAVADPEGRFEVLGLAPGKLDLKVTASGFATTEIRGVEITRDSDFVDFGTLVLEPGVRLEGRVVDADRRPLAGARVRWWSWNSDHNRGPRGSGRPTVTSDADGRFAVKDLTRGDKLTLEVALKGYSQVQAAGVEAPVDEPLVLVLEAQAVVRGTVVDDSGEPVPKASVSVWFQSVGGGGSGSSHSSEADGSFEIEVDAGDEVKLRATSAGLSSSELGLEIAPGQTIDGVRLVMEPGAVVEGLVLRPDDEPVVGAMVMAMGDRPFRNTQELTGADGAFRIEGLDLGSARLYVSAEGFPQAEKTLEVGPGVNSVEIRMRETHEVRGRVVDETLGPVGGAQVSLSGPDYGSAASDVDGHFVITVPDGRYRLSAFKQGAFAPVQLEEEVEVAGEAVTGLEIRLVEGGAIVGRVLGLEPDRMRNVQVAARGGGGGPVDHEGNYRIEHLSPREWVVEAFERGSGGRSARGRVVLEPGVSETILDLEFTSGVTLAGRVMLDNEPSPGARVQVSELLTGTNQALGSRYAQSDYRGTFVFADLQPGDYRLEVRQGSLVRQLDLELRSDREVEIELQALELSGRVLDAETGQPLQDAQVALEPTRGESRAGWPSHRTDAGGLFRFARVAEGNYRLRVTHEGYAPLAQPVEVSEGAYLQGLELRLDRAEGLTLQVRLATGGVPPRVWVAALGASGEVLFNRGFQVPESGDVELSNLPTGSWMLLVGALQAATLQFGVTAPGDPVPVQLPPDTILDVRVPELAADSEHASLTVTSTAGQPFLELSAQSSLPIRQWAVRDGRSTVTGLPPGEWIVNVTAVGERSWSGSVTAQGGRMTLELQ